MVYWCKVLFSTFLVLNFFWTINASSYLDQLHYDCSRACDTHFSGSACWEKTFTYFSNNIIQSLVDYANANAKTGFSKEISKKTLNDVYNEYKSDDEIKDFIANVIPEFDSIFNFTVGQLDDLVTNVVDKDKEIQCPVECDPSSLNVWIALFGVCVGLTVATIIFVALYIMFTKIKYRKIDSNN